MRIPEDPCDLCPSRQRCAMIGCIEDDERMDERERFADERLEEELADARAEREEAKLWKEIGWL